MPEFLELLPPPDALQTWLANISATGEGEVIEVESSLGRVLLRSVIAPHPLPAFPRSTVDGFAVIAADTYGASDSLPAYLMIENEVNMGSAPGFHLKRGSGALIHTGGMLPDGADAVVMVEHTQRTGPRSGAQEIEVLRPAAVGENVLRVGEDVQAGKEVLPAGKRIRPAEIGGLMALGITPVEVARRPRVGILSSGDEVVSPHMDPEPGQVRDVNAYTLSALVEQAGGEPVRYGIIPDHPEAIYAAASRALAECDLVVITAGSSASTRDLTADVINRMGKPGVLVHGVNVRPGKPTILGICNGKGVVGLPGNPVSALVIASLFVVPAVETLSGLVSQALRPRVPARLGLNLASQAGREDWIAVRLIPLPPSAAGTGESFYQAEPVFGKSNLIFTLARADGLLRIPPDANGMAAGEPVEIYLF